MTSRIFLTLMMLLCLIHPSAFANRDEGMTPANGFFLPDGNPEAGRTAFARLKCNACHWVQNELKLNDPVAEKTGPMLGSKQADYSPGWLANSMVSPSHTIALNGDGEAEDSELSRMGDFRDTMTVQEMIDMVAYIRSLDDQDTETEMNDIEGGAL